MKKYLLPFLMLVMNNCFSQATIKFAQYSTFVNDTFDITLSSTRDISLGGFTKAVFYLDANFRSGRSFRKLISNSGDTALSNYLFIGIADRARLHKYRRRDYIPPVISEHGIIQSKTKNYGHADQFCSFLGKELVPQIKSRFHIEGGQTLIGHSYSGLFVFYCLFAHEELFQNYIALSPALWVNKSNIFGYEEMYWRTHSELNHYVFLSAGKLEVFNLILHGTRKMKRLLQKRNYRGLKFEYRELKGKAHKNQVPSSLQYLFSNHRI
jgi:predicted alpha/beta superfamily hydrolase